MDSEWCRSSILVCARCAEREVSCFYGELARGQWRRCMLLSLLLYCIT